MSGKKIVRRPAWSYTDDRSGGIRVTIATEWVRWKGTAPPADAEAVKRFLRTLETENIGRSFG